MGSFLTNYQVRSDSASRVREALATLVTARAYVSPPKNGWVTVYEEASDEQDDQVLRRVALGLSKALKTAVLAFLVHDSDVLVYWLWQEGRLVDEFNSAPDYFKQVSDATRAWLRGNTDALLPLCVAGITREQVEAVLHPAEGAPLMAESTLTDLAALLGIDDARVSLGFRYFEDEGEELLPDIADFEPVGRGAERKEAREPEAGDQAGVRTPDPYVFAVGLLANYWGVDQQIGAMFSGAPVPGINREDVARKLRAQFDRNARQMLQRMASPGRPTFEELKTARDEGPEALAELVARRTPELMTDIAVGAVAGRLTQFVAELVRRGLDPNATGAQGLSPLAAAERYGPNSAMYLLLKSAA